MTADLTVLALCADLTNANGDVENALVLAQRARWGGFSAETVRLDSGERLPHRAPDAIVLGSSSDVDLIDVIASLQPERDRLAEWLAAGIPFLAVDSGWEALGESIELPSGTVAGLSLVGSRSVASTRVTDDLIVDSRWGRLIGFENHARDTLLPDDVEPLGSVSYGRGNGSGAAEGLVAGSLFATHLHGPVLAKNPRLADEILTRVLGADYAPTAHTAIRADETARAARNVIATRLGRQIEAV